MKARFFKHKSLLLFAVVLLPGCAFFARKPPLPRQASVERLPEPATGTDFSAEVQDADIIYFPTERAASGGRSEPAALLLEALQKRAQPFAIGWDMIDSSQQPLLDQVETARDNKREEVIAQLDLLASGRAREHCRAVLRETRATRVQYLALRGSREILGKIILGDRLTSDEEKFLPRGYKAPSSEARSSRVEVLEREFVADAIVRSFRGIGSGNKLLVFARAQNLETEVGLPYFVAQKIHVRQLVLGSDSKGKERSRMLAAM